MSEDEAGFALSFQTACTGLLAYRVIQSFILLTCLLLLLRLFHLLLVLSSGLVVCTFHPI